MTREDEIPTPSPTRSSVQDVSPEPSATLSPEPSVLALVPRKPFVLLGGRPTYLAYSPDARYIAVVGDSKSGSLALSVYDAVSGAPVEGPQPTGVAQLAMLPRGSFVAGIKGGLVFSGRSTLQIPFAKGTLQSLCASPSADSVLVSLEEPSALVLFTGGQGQGRVRLPHQGAAHQLVLWAEQGPLAVSGEGVQALRIEGGSLEMRGAPHPWRFLDPTEGIYWGQSVLIGSMRGRLLAVELNAEGVPLSHSELQRSSGSSALGGLQAHTRRIHTFLVGFDPLQLVSVAQSPGDENGAMARWERDSRGAWSFRDDFEVRAGQVCVTQGGLQREWVAAAVLISWNEIVLRQTPTKRFLRASRRR